MLTFGLMTCLEHRKSGYGFCRTCGHPQEGVEEFDEGVECRECGAGEVFGPSALIILEDGRL
jgi:hypothetical protein